jgi:DNA processing protein
MFDSSRRVQLSKLPSCLYAEPVYTSSADEQAALVALLRERPEGQNWLQLAGAVLEIGSPRQAREVLVPAELFPSDEYTALMRAAATDVKLWAEQGLDFWTILDGRYPARLRDIHQAPPFLFARGHRVDDDVAVSVVGSRDASPRGLRMATSIAQALVDMKLTVIAGLAAGIDTAAHVAALERGGRTVAVIGTGINRVYPAPNRRLQETIATEGLLLSQFWPDAPPQPHNFPMRNAIMSGYGIATVVVEAGEKSGARTQARMAVEHGRPVILTDLVVERTDWGKALIGRPDVYAVSSTREVSQIVRRLVERPGVLDEALRHVAV